MVDLDAENELLITCAPGLAGALRGELEALGFRISSFHPGGVGTAACFRDAMLLNLRLRTAYNVLYLLKRFTCRDPEELYRRTASIPWEAIIPNDGYLSVVSRVETPTIKHTLYPNLKVKDAIVDRIAERTGRRHLEEVLRIIVMPTCTSARLTRATERAEFTRNANNGTVGVTELHPLKPTAILTDGWLQRGYSNFASSCT